MSYHMLPTPPLTQESSQGLDSSQEPGVSTGLIMMDESPQFRIGGPGHLPALPLQSEKADVKSSAYTAYLALEARIDVSLSDAGVSDYTMSLCKRFVAGETPMDTDHTIFIQTKKQPGWQTALGSILELLRMEKAPSIRVEIIDMGAVPQYFLPDVDASFKAAWPSLEVQIIGALGRESPEWETISVFNRGHTKEHSLPTVTIGLTKVASPDWQKERYDKVKNLLQPHGDVKVAYVRSALLMAGSNTLPPSPRLPVEAFSGPVDMGSSIGVGDKTGTLGGYVTLRFPDRELVVMGLTNHHVISTTEMTEDEEDNGYPPKSRDRPQICAPSDADQMNTLTKLEYKVSNKEDLLYGRQRGRRRQGGLAGEVARLGDKATESQREQLRDDLADLNRITNDILTIRNANRDFGTVFASSGSRRGFGGLITQHDEHGRPCLHEDGSLFQYKDAMDWALIRVNEDRKGANTRPTSELFSEFSFGRPNLQIVNASNTSADQGALMFKKGRNGHTVGRVSDISCTIKFHPRTDLWRALVIEGELSEHEPVPFMFEGDSGCWGLDQPGNWHNLGFAGCADDNAGYAIPVSNLFEDIEKTIGAKIISPSFLLNEVRGGG